MSKFIMLVGLPASGKSTLAEKLSKEENAIVLSSDKLREELFNDVNNQDNNGQLFEIMNSRANKLIQQGKNVIYDATNINRKRRKHLINHVVKADENIVYYINNHVMTANYRDENRNRTVGKEVIYRMYKNLQIPVENEGWNQIIYTEHPSKYFEKFRKEYELTVKSGLDHDELFKQLGKMIPEFRDITDLPQDSTYHSFSVSRHTYYVYKTIFNLYNKEDKLIMLWATLFHDLGKAFCKSFVNHKGEENKYAHFIGHENVSSQLAAVYLDLFGYDQEFVKQVTTLVQFHMMPMKSTKDKMDEVKLLIGDDLFNKLLILHEADLNAK
jgi:predicted kinase